MHRKYVAWARAKWCEPGTPVFWSVGNVWWSLHKCIVVALFRTWLAYLRPGDLVLDWGSGCGHKLSWANRLFGVEGLGVELVKATAAWARRHSAGTHCHADGRDLSWIPSGSFDAVISFAALYHLHGREQCDVVGQLVEKLRPGGRAWLGWMAPYAHYAFLLRGTGATQGMVQGWPTGCPASGPPAPGWAAICAEGERHMVPPQPTWDSCFERLRRGRWRLEGVDATFHWRSEWGVFADPRDRAALRRKYPEDLPGYSLFIERAALVRRQAGPIQQRQPATFRVAPSAPGIVARLLWRSARIPPRARCTQRLARLTRSLYYRGLGEPALRRGVRSSLRRLGAMESCMHMLPQMQLLATEFMLADRLRMLGSAPPPNPHACAMPVLHAFLRYHEMHHELMDAATPSSGQRQVPTQLLADGEQRIARGLRALWSHLLFASKSWNAAVGSLGFCDCSISARVQIDSAVALLGMREPGFAVRVAEPSSPEATRTLSINGCDEVWAFEQAIPVADRLRDFTRQEPGSRFRCAPLAAGFLAICAQRYIVQSQILKARDALQLAAFVALMAGDCTGEGLADPPLRTVDILYNYARVQRLALRQGGGGRTAIAALAWRASGLADALGGGVGAPRLDDAVPRNFPGSKQAVRAAHTVAASWVCDLTSCRERLPRSLAGSMGIGARSAGTGADDAAAARERLRRLLAPEAAGALPECHRFTPDDLRFFEQRIEALRLGTTSQRCVYQRSTALSSWRADGILEVKVPASATWRFSTLVPLPWSTLHLLEATRRSELESQWPQTHVGHAGPGHVNVTAHAPGKEVHGVKVSITGLDETHCTVNSEVHVRAHPLSRKLLKQRAARRAGLQSDKLISLIVVVLDSTPAPAWDVFCPKLLGELQRAKGADANASHESFRFHEYHALLDPECDCLTQDNMMTFFGGRRPPRASAQSRRLPGAGGRFQEALAGWSFLWDEAKAAGYVTLSADDSCSRSPLNVADPAYSYFDAYAPTLANGSEDCSAEVFCRHRELLDYSARWLDAHKGLPRFAYMHFDGTHGTRPEELVRYDAHLAAWVHDRLHAPGGEHTALVIMSDHGVQSGDGRLTAQPFLAAWLPRRLLNSMGAAVAEALRQNGRRLLTPFDAHFTLQQLLQASLAYARGSSPVLVPQRPPRPTWLPVTAHVVRSVLFPLPVSRSCSDAGLHAAFCFCAAWGTTWQSFQGGRQEAERLAGSLVELVNRQARSSLLATTVDLSACRQQSLSRLEAVRERTDGSLVELVVATAPLGLLWKAVARHGATAAEAGGADKAAHARLEVVSVEQITRYFPHEHCTPAGIDPKFCACNLRVVHRLTLQERFWMRWPS